MAKLGKYLEENILSLGIISLLLLIPLYPKFPIYQIPNTYVAVRLEDLWVGVIFIIWLIIEIKQKLPTFKEKISRLIAFYLLIGLFAVINSLLITKTVITNLAIFHYLRRIEYMCLFWVALASIKNLQKVKSFLYTIFIATIGVFIFGIGQKYFNWPVISTMNEEFSKGMVLYLSEWTRINATFAGHYDLAAFSVLVLALVIGFILGVKKWLVKFIMLLLAMMVFYLLLLTASRISFVAYLLMISLIFILAKKKIWLPPIIVISIVAMLLSGDLGERFGATFKIDLSFLSARIHPVKQQEVFTPTPTPLPMFKPETTPGKVVVEKITPTPTIIKKIIPVEEFPPPEAVELATQRSGEIRFKVEWPRAVRAFLKNPLWGTGYSSVTLATDNDYLRALAETGILGFGALMLIFFEIARRLILFIRVTKWSFEKAIVIGLTGSVIGLLANAVFIDVLEASKVAFTFWILAGIMVGVMNQMSSKIEK